jgi:hypothetical protein
VDEKLKAYGGKRVSEPGGGQSSPKLVENRSSQHLIKKELTASDEERGPDPGGA